MMKIDLTICNDNDLLYSVCSSDGVSEPNAFVATAPSQAVESSGVNYEPAALSFQGKRGILLYY